MFLDDFYTPIDLDMDEFRKYIDLYWIVYSYDPRVEYPEEELLATVPAKRCVEEDFPNDKDFIKNKLHVAP